DRAGTDEDGPLGRGAVSQAVARRRVTKLAHSPLPMISTGPCGSLESRTATMPERLAATSTHLTSLAEYDDFRQVPRSRIMDHQLDQGGGLVIGRRAGAQMVEGQRIPGSLVTIPDVPRRADVLHVHQVALALERQQHESPAARAGQTVGVADH